MAASASSQPSFIDTKSLANGVREIILNRPKVNAMSAEFLRQLLAAVRAANADDAVKAVLITSASAPKVFSGGLDLKAASEHDSTAKLVAYTELISESLTSPLSVGKPVACVVSGAAIAGGMVLACACDFVAIDSSVNFRVGVTEVAVGVPFPRAAYEVVALHVGRGPARDLRGWVYTGKTVPAKEGFALGFGDVYTDQPRQAALDWIDLMLSFNPGVFAITKRQISAPFFVATQHANPKLTGTTSIRSQNEEGAVLMAPGLGVVPSSPAVRSKL